VSLIPALRATAQPFYCEICDKQYKATMEFQNHLSSYDHHHTKVRVRPRALPSTACARCNTSTAASQRSPVRDV
jgi:hypothetical protein